MLTVILVALVQSISTARGGTDPGVSGEVANNSSNNRAFNAAARPGIRWINDRSGYKESYCWKPVFHHDVLRVLLPAAHAATHSGRYPH
jgi:hypothetical protein